VISSTSPSAEDDPSDEVLSRCSQHNQIDACRHGLAVGGAAIPGEPRVTARASRSPSIPSDRQHGLKFGARQQAPQRDAAQIEDLELDGARCGEVEPDARGVLAFGGKGVREILKEDGGARRGFLRGDGAEAGGQQNGGGDGAAGAPDRAAGAQTVAIWPRRTPTIVETPGSCMVTP
jgi:hypothetical protein